jgi:hypothetical protein
VGPWSWGVALLSMLVLVATRIHPLIVLAVGAVSFDLADRLGWI